MRKSLYKVVIGYFEGKHPAYNFHSENIVAFDAEGAIKKYKRKRNEFIQEVIRLEIIDKP